MDWNFGHIDQDAYGIDVEAIDQLEERQAQDRPPSNSNGQLAKLSSRRRIARACDRCNAVRTRCDGEAPCGYCEGMLPSF